MIGKKIKKIRGELGLTQQELAHKSGLTGSTINFIETERVKKPYPKTINKIAKALKVSIEYLLDEKNEGKNMIKEPKQEYQKNEEITQGFKDLINDDELRKIYKIDSEEIDWMRTIRFKTKDKPTKETYIDLIKIYRKIKGL